MIRGLFGGSFDPVHNGHVAMVRHVLTQRLVDHVVVVPARRSPLKDGTGAPAADRLEMVRLALAGLGGVTVDPREITRPGASWTIETLRALTTEHPQDAWRLVVGADNLADFPRWREPEALLALAELLVMPRRGMALLRPVGCAPERFHVADGFDHPVSSTGIRAKLGRGELPVGDLPAVVVAHIRARGLYGVRRP